MAHKHVWITKYVTFEHRYECASGMICECGATLSQDEVEEIVNAAQQSRVPDAGDSGENN